MKIKYITYLYADPSVRHSYHTHKMINTGTSVVFQNRTLLQKKGFKKREFLSKVIKQKYTITTV